MTDHIDRLISRSLADLESSLSSDSRQAAAKQRVLAHFDELEKSVGPGSDRATSESVELLAVEPLNSDARPARRLAVAAAVALIAAVGLASLVRGGASSSIDATDSDNSPTPPTAQPAPDRQQPVDSDWTAPAGLKIDETSDDALLLSSADHNTGFVILSAADDWNLEERLNELVSAGTASSTRRATSVDGTFVESFEVFVTSTASAAQECAVAQPCIPLVGSSDGAAWLRAGYHHTVLAVEPGDRGSVVVIAWTDQPFDPHFAPLINSVLDSLQR
ncbi:MAG: hypothetical protein ACN4GZ_17420 [Acidimicrobiales bacterium]